MLSKKKYYEYSSKNDIISANSPVASDRANPRIAYENSCHILIIKLFLS